MGIAYLVAWLLLSAAAEGAYYVVPSLQASALFSGMVGALVASLAGFVAATGIFAIFLSLRGGGFGRISGYFKPLRVLHGGFVMGVFTGKAIAGVVAGAGLALMVSLGRGLLLFRSGLGTPSGLVRREGQAISNWAPSAREGGGGERVDIYCAHPRLGSVPATSDARRRLWDVYRDGEALVLGLGVRDTVALSPDGRWLLTAGSGKVFLQNAITNSRLVMTGTSAAPAAGAGFFVNRDAGGAGSSAVLLVRADGACEEWQVSTGSGARRNPVIQSGSLARAYPSPLGDWVAVVDGAGNLLVIYRSGQHTRPIPRAAGQARVTAVAVSPTGTHLAVATVRQRDEASAEEKGGVLEVAPADGKEAPRAADGRYGIILSATFNPSGTTLAWATQRGIVYAWALAEPAPRRLGEGIDAERGVAFVDDAAVGAFQNGKPILLAVERRGESRGGAALSPAAAALAAIRAQTAAPSEEEDDDEGPLVVAEAWKWKGSSRKLPTRALPLMAGGGRLAVGEVDGSVSFWDLREGKLADVREGHRGPIGFLRWDPGERMLYSVAVLTAARTAVVDAWEVRSTRAAALASSAVIHPDLRIVPASDWYQSVLLAATGVACAWYVGANLHVVHVGEPSLRSIENEHRGPITCVALSPDGEDAAIGHDDGVVRLWNVTDQQALRTWRAHRGSVDDVKYSSDGKVLVTMSSNEGVAVWDAHSGRRIWAAGGRRGMKGAGLTTVAITANGDRVAVATRDGAVDVWTLKDSQQKSYAGLKATPWALAFGAKGDVLGGADQTGIIGMWDVRSGTWLGQTPFQVQGASSFAVRSEPRMLAVGDINGAVRVWGPK